MEFNRETCTQCGICEDICLQKAIHLGNFTIDDNCNLCYHCLAVCPHGSITENGKLTPDLSAQIPSAESLLNLMKHRRSIRHFKEQEIPEELVQQILESVRFAPSARNAREVFITAVIGKDQMTWLDTEVTRTLNWNFQRFFNGLTKPLWQIIAGEKSYAYFRVKEKFMNKQKHQPQIITYNAPMALLFHSPKSLIGNADMDCNIWMTYAMLYAESLGLGSCVNGYLVSGIKHNQTIKQKLGIPKNHMIYSALLLGYPKYRFKREVFREKILSPLK